MGYDISIPIQNFPAKTAKVLSCVSPKEVFASHKKFSIDQLGVTRAQDIYKQDYFYTDEVDQKLQDIETKSAPVLRKLATHQPVDKILILKPHEKRSLVAYARHLYHRSKIGMDELKNSLGKTEIELFFERPLGDMDFFVVSSTTPLVMNFPQPVLLNIGVHIDNTLWRGAGFPLSSDRFLIFVYKDEVESTNEVKFLYEVGLGGITFALNVCASMYISNPECSIVFQSKPNNVELEHIIDKTFLNAYTSLIEARILSGFDWLEKQTRELSVWSFRQGFCMFIQDDKMTVGHAPKTKSYGTGTMWDLDNSEEATAFLKRASVAYPFNLAFSIETFAICHNATRNLLARYKQDPEGVKRLMESINRGEIDPASV
jgi:hypothetical protein